MKRFFFFAVILTVILSSCITEDETIIPDAGETEVSEYYVPVEQALESLDAFLDAIDPPTRGGSLRTVADVTEWTTHDFY